MGEVTKKKLAIARKTDLILRQALLNHPIEKSLFQYFTVVTNTQSTAIKNNQRFYGYVVAIRMVESQDAKVANYYQMPYDLLNSITDQMLKIDGVSRVVYDITNKPPGTIEWE